MSIKEAFWEYLVGKSSITDLVDLRVYQSVSQGYATGLLTVTVNPSNTNTVTIDDKVYTFQTALTNVDGNVAIGVDIDTSLDNLVAAINLAPGSGSKYAAKTSLHDTVSASRPLTGQMEVMALSISLSGDLDTTETLGNGAWGQTTMNTYPFIALKRLPTEHLRSMDGGAGLAFTVMQCDCVGLNSIDPESVADGVFAICEGKDATTIGSPPVVIEHMSTQNEDDQFESPVDAEDVGKFHQIIEVNMLHRETVPSP